MTDDRARAAAVQAAAVPHGLRGQGQVSRGPRGGGPMGAIGQAGGKSKGF